MMYLEGVQDIAVTVGEIVLHLSEYHITGGCLVREQGNAEGTASVAVLYPKGTRITLKGKVTPPLEHFASVGAALDGVLRGGDQVVLHMGFLTARNAMLIGYTMEQGAFPMELTLVFFTTSALEDESEP